MNAMKLLRRVLLTAALLLLTALMIEAAEKYNDLSLIHISEPTRP